MKRKIVKFWKLKRLRKVTGGLLQACGNRANPNLCGRHEEVSNVSCSKCSHKRTAFEEDFS